MITYSIILAAVLAAASPSNNNAGHDGMQKIHCSECHKHLPFTGGGPALRNEVSDTCVACHQRHHGTDKMRSHPVNALPSMSVPPDMILDAQGRITCITCHAFHGEYRDENNQKRYYLRRTGGKTFCFSCHKSLPGIAHKR
jgi:hypothetical protein